MSIRTDPTFRKLLEIRESLFKLLGVRPRIDHDIHIAIRNLRANPLYRAGTHPKFEEDLETLIDRTSRKWCTYHVIIEPRKHLYSRQDLQAHFEALLGKIIGEVSSRGEEARLGELALKPFLKTWEEAQKILKEEKEKEEKEEKVREWKEKTEREEKKSLGGYLEQCVVAECSGTSD